MSLTGKTKSSEQGTLVEEIYYSDSYWDWDDFCSVHGPTLRWVTSTRWRLATKDDLVSLHGVNT